MSEPLPMTDLPEAVRIVAEALRERCDGFWDLSTDEESADVARIAVEALGLTEEPERRERQVPSRLISGTMMSEMYETGRVRFVSPWRDAEPTRSVREVLTARGREPARNSDELDQMTGRRMYEEDAKPIPDLMAALQESLDIVQARRDTEPTNAQRAQKAEAENARLSEEPQGAAESLGTS